MPPTTADTTNTVAKTALGCTRFPRNQRFCIPFDTERVATQCDRAMPPAQPYAVCATTTYNAHKIPLEILPKQYFTTQEDCNIVTSPSSTTSLPKINAGVNPKRAASRFRRQEGPICRQLL